MILGWTARKGAFPRDHRPSSRVSIRAALSAVNNHWSYVGKSPVGVTRGFGSRHIRAEIRCLNWPKFLEAVDPHEAAVGGWDQSPLRFSGNGVTVNLPEIEDARWISPIFKKVLQLFRIALNGARCPLAIKPDCLADWLPIQISSSSFYR